MSWEQKQTLDISWQSVWRFFSVPLLFLAIWFFRKIILYILAAFIIASLLEQPIDYLASKIKKRWLATLIIYLISLLIIGLLIYLTIPFISEAIINFIEAFKLDINSENLRNFIQDWRMMLTPLKNYSLSSLKSLDGQFWDLFIKLSNAVIKIMTDIFSGFFIFILAFFLNTERNGIEKGIKFITPHNYEEYVVYLWEKARKKISGWFYSQLILSLFVGLNIFVSFKILALPNAEFLAIFAAFLDFIPYIGPFIAGLVATIFSLTQGLIFGILSLVIFVVVQFLENMIAPSIRSHMMQMNPLIIIFAILFGSELAGGWGVIIALPLVATLIEFIQDLRSGKINTYLPQKKLLS